MSKQMQVDKLKQIRDNVEKIELSIPLEELCERYEKLYTGAVNDVLREMCLPYQALPSSIMPLRDEMVVCGEAFTVKAVKDPTMSGEMELRVEMLDDLRPGHVVIWNANANGIEQPSHWGGVMTQASMKRGCRGAIIDGGIRDTKDILSQNFPIWYRYRTSSGALSHTKVVAYQVPIFVGEVIVRPGDILLADIDGGLVIPRKIAVAVLERAEQIERNEGEIKEWVAAGLTAEEIHDRGGYF
ncbi:RraA family protein [Coraliomargarita algicola]|uniref:Putative 4-hydroxy-4-methyl-2-oxoglutarate aldolase n=1 Tax=Coraliomargarita algicola TaxID=3092156 RepID=A0ABZ0RG79_9BACT|nr:RraA family protein [Coraliomargarita sp. J2-16]WPJ95174.1 RraA family protein [Coraliomargarita sp. J2-16]